MRVALFLLFLLILSACTPSAPDVTRTGVTAMPITATAIEDENIQATAIITDEPIMSAQETLSCPNAPEIRLIIQERGRVTDDNNDTLNLRNGPGISFDIRVALNPRDVFMVLDGPTCEDGFSWFRVRYRNFTGWIAEGDNEAYYVEPYLTG